MADSDTGIQETSMPYVYPRLPTDDSLENKSPESNSQDPETDAVVNDDKSNKEENESPESDEKDEDEKKDTEKPLIEETKIEIPSDNEGEDTPTLALPDKKSKSKENSEMEREQKAKLPRYLFPFTNIKDAWNESSNVFQFLGTTTCIIFQTIGWFTCVGGVPFLSLAMLIIGSIYVDDCNIEPKIPVYLIVTGVIGTIQHFLAVWIKYVPKDSKGKLMVYRSYCRIINGVFHLFLIVWFILGCIWVYGSHSDVVFKGTQRREYCNQTLYYFSFWILNLSFIILGLLIFLSMCFLIFAIAIDE